MFQKKLLRYNNKENWIFLLFFFLTNLFFKLNFKPTCFSWSDQIQLILMLIKFILIFHQWGFHEWETWVVSILKDIYFKKNCAINIFINYSWSKLEPIQFHDSLKVFKCNSFCTLSQLIIVFLNEICFVVFVSNISTCLKIKIIASNERFLTY